MKTFIIDCGIALFYTICMILALIIIITFISWGFGWVDDFSWLAFRIGFFFIFMLMFMLAVSID